MAINKEQVKQLLGTGLSVEVVATAVGCAHEYISLLMADEQFKEEVVTLRTVALTAASARDRGIDGIEETLIERLKELIDSRSIYRPRDILSAFHVMNNAKRRGVQATNSLTINNTVVNLQLPKAVTRKFTINQTGEVIGVEDQTLVTMPTHQLLANLSKEAKDGEGKKYEDVGRFVPPSRTFEG